MDAVNEFKTRVCQERTDENNKKRFGTLYTYKQIGKIVR
jgi:hypothetical protein